MTSRRHRNEPALTPLAATCFLRGRGPHQDAYFVLLQDNTVRVLIHEGGISGRDNIESTRAAAKTVDRLKRSGWKFVATPRRSEEQARGDLMAAAKAFNSRKTRIYREPDPESNLVPPARELLRQRERVAESAIRNVTAAKPLQGGAIETNRRKH